MAWVPKRLGELTGPDADVLRSIFDDLRRFLEDPTFERGIRIGDGASTYDEELGITTPVAAERFTGVTSGALLAKVELEAPSQSFVFNGIEALAADFENLRVVYHSRSAATGDQVRAVVLRFNGDTSSSYHSQVIRDGTLSQILSHSGVRVGEIDGTSTTRLSAGVVDMIDFKRPAGRPVIGRSMSIQDANVVEISSAGTWNLADVITSVHLDAGGNTFFAAGGKAWLYGY